MNFNNLFFHIHYCNMKPFQGSLTRTLQHHALIFIVEGIGNFTIKNKKSPFQSGTLFYIRPDVLHSLEVSQETPMYFMSVHFSYVNVLLNENKWDIQNETAMLPFHAIQELKDSYHVSDIFKKLVERWNLKLPGYELITRALLQQLIFEIFESTKKKRPNFSIAVKVEKIIQYMYENVNRRITLTELADMVQLSSAYLSRAFKTTTGYSLIEFFNKMKVDKAKELMIEGEVKVKEIAEALGFSDEFYFSRIFKKIEGISPSEFYSKNVHEN